MHNIPLRFMAALGAGCPRAYLIHNRNPAVRIRARTGMRQPMAAPILRCRPDLVKGMPICRLSLALAWEIPRNLFQEKPPLFMLPSFLPKF